MAKPSLIDNWLDQWEELKAQGQKLSPADFVARHCGDAAPELIQIFISRANALQAVDAGLGGIEPPPVTSGESDTGQSGLTASSLVAGAEPVSGYRLVRLIDRGGFGEVWEALGPGGFPVAMKFVPLGGKKGTIEQSALELIKGIGHPHLLSVFGAWQTPSWLVIATELAESTLAHRLARVQQQGGPGIPLPELLVYMREAAEGLDSLHAKGIQHRDIKPANLLLVGGAVKVADYGLAKLVGETAVSHSGAMTPAYAAPEFFSNQTSPHSDQYSLAAAYCQLRGGRLPFSGTALELMQGHVQKNPDLSMLPEGERPVVARALAKEPGKRWPSCRAFVQALAGTLEPAETTQDAAPARRRAGRPKSRWFLAGTVVLVLVGLTWVLFSRWSPRDPKQDRASHSATNAAPAASQEPSSEKGPASSRPPEQEPLILRGHKGPVTRVAFAGGGRRAVSGAEDGTVRVWDLQKGQELHCLRGHTDPISSLAGSPDHPWVVSGGSKEDPTVRLWDVEAGRELCCLTGHTDRVSCVAFLPGSQQAVSGSFDGTVKVWDLEKQKENSTLILSKFAVPKTLYDPRQVHAVYSMALLHRGNQLIVGTGDGLIRWLELKDGRMTRFLRVQRHLVTAVVVEPDDTSVLTASSDHLRPPNSGVYDGRVCLWELPSGRQLACHESLRKSNCCLAFLADGKRAVSAGVEGKVLLWDAESGRLLKTIGEAGGEIHGLAVAPDGRSVLAACRDRTVRYWPLPMN